MGSRFMCQRQGRRAPGWGRWWEVLEAGPAWPRLRCPGIRLCTPREAGFRKAPALAFSSDL